MWAREIHKRVATFDEPSDDVRLAILRAKDRSIHEKTQRLKAGNSGDDDIKSLTKLLIVGQLNQMSRQPLGESNLQGRPAVSTLDQVLSSSSWTPIEYEYLEEIIEHTKNFFPLFKIRYAEYSELVDGIKDTLNENHMDIN
jgi:hypothetical protein